jgi:hypothetical protein
MGRIKTMSTIDADAAKLAGLQIDLLQKVRQGNVTLDHLEWFLGLNKATRDALVVGERPASKLVSPAKPTKKFALLVDLGTITVPNDYDHATWLALFSEKNRQKLYHYNDVITDPNFSKPSRILKPGDKLRVWAFKQIVPGTTTSEERMAFLATQKAVHTGAQGASFVFEQKRDQLPKGFWYTSFDEKDRLWKDADGSHRMPYVYAYSGGGFHFDLGYFEGVWDDDDAFLCFCDIE